MSVAGDERPMTIPNRGSSPTTRRDRVLSRTLAPAPLPKRFRTSVVGVSFVDGYPANLRRLERLLAHQRWERTFATSDAEVLVVATLTRDPTNTHDPNAVIVSANGEPIGHLPRRVAAQMAPLLDAGEEWVAAVVEILSSDAEPDRPGVVVEIRRGVAGADGRTAVPEDLMAAVISEAVADMPPTEVRVRLAQHSYQPSESIDDDRARLVSVILAERARLVEHTSAVEGAR